LLTPTERVLRARLAAHAMHAAGRTNTRPATAAFMARFEAEVDPDNSLSPSERAFRAAHARKAHFARLALASVRKRRQANDVTPRGRLSGRQKWRTAAGPKPIRGSRPQRSRNDEHRPQELSASYTVTRHPGEASRGCADRR